MTRKRVHNWMQARGVHRRLDPAPLEGDTFKGVFHFSDANGKGGTGTFETEIVEVLPGEKTVTHFCRTKRLRNPQSKIRGGNSTRAAANGRQASP